MAGAGAAYDADALARAFAPALETDDAGFPVAFGGVALARKGRPSFVVLCAPDESASSADMDWEALAALVSEGVSLRLRLSVRALPLALAHLEQAGAGPGMPTAIVYRLKSPFFKTAQSTLHETAQLVRRVRPASPVDVLVGRYVAPVKPSAGRELVGRTIAVACEAGTPAKLANLLREAGARVFEQPVADASEPRGEETADAEPGDSARSAEPAAPRAVASTSFTCDALAAGLEDAAIDVVVLPDAQLAGAFFRLLGPRAQTLLASAKIVACGPIAGSVVEQHGLAPALQTDSYVPSRVAEAVRALDLTASSPR